MVAMMPKSNAKKAAGRTGGHPQPPSDDVYDAQCTYKLGQYNINSNAPPYKYGNFSSRDFFGFGVVASKENADLARRRRIWRLFSATKSTTQNRERDLVYQICNESSVINK